MFGEGTLYHTGGDWYGCVEASDGTLYPWFVPRWDTRKVLGTVIFP